MIINNKSVMLTMFLSINCFFSMCGMEGFNNFYDENTRQMHFHIIKRAQAVENAGDSMSSTEKLENLIGDNYFEKRKDIIKFMIEHEKVHPNNISYQTDSPLCEGIIQDDIDFVIYLLNHGARPKPKDLNLNWVTYNYGKVQRNDMLRQLFLQHSIMFYKINNKGDILPVWHHNDPLQNIIKSLSYLIDCIKTKQPETYFVMDVPYEKKEVLDEIKKIGFTIRYSDKEITQLIYKKENKSKDDKAFNHNPADIVKYVNSALKPYPAKYDLKLWERGK